MSFTSARGDTRGLTPPRRSCSASCREVRSSKRESPPSIAAMKGESGRRIELI